MSRDVRVWPEAPEAMKAEKEEARTVRCLEAAARGAGLLGWAIALNERTKTLLPYLLGWAARARHDAGRNKSQ